MDKRVKQIGIETRKKIYDFLAENGYSPSIREICEGIGIASTSSVHHHLSVLQDMGKIHMKENKTRAISIVGYEFKKSEV